MHASVPNALKNPNKPSSVWEVGWFPALQTATLADGHL